MLGINSGLISKKKDSEKKEKCIGALNSTVNHDQQCLDDNQTMTKILIAMRFYLSCESNLGRRSQNDIHSNVHS